MVGSEWPQTLPLISQITVVSGWVTPTESLVPARWIFGISSAYCVWVTPGFIFLNIKGEEKKNAKRQYVACET